MKKKFSYLICYSTMSGVGDLQQFLREQGCGVPVNIFSPQRLTAYAKENGTKELNIKDYITDYASKTRGENGVFGASVDFHTLTSTLKGSPGFAVNFLKSFDSLIYLEKRDKLLQAASIYVVTAKAKNTTLEFDANKVGNCLKNVLIEQDGWQQIFKKAELTPTIILTEEFQSKKLQVFKDLSKATGVDAKSLKSGDVKIASKWTDEIKQMRDQYAAFLGLDKAK